MPIPLEDDMVTRLEEHTEARTLLDEPDVPRPLIQVGAPSSTPRDIPTRALLPAMAAWMTLVFGVCYVALPTLLSTVSWTGGVLYSIWFNLPGFVLATFVTLVGAAAWQPKIKTDVRAPADPVFAAAAGGLLTWAAIHNVAPFLRHFDQFGALELAGFLLVNIVEMTMIGMMLASFTRSRVAAFGLGAAFQLLVLGLILSLIVV